MTFRPAISPKARREQTGHLGPTFVLEAISCLSARRQEALVTLAADLGLISDEQAAIIRRTVLEVAHG